MEDKVLKNKGVGILSEPCVLQIRVHLHSLLFTDCAVCARRLEKHSNIRKTYFLSFLIKHQAPRKLVTRAEVTKDEV